MSDFDAFGRKKDDAGLEDLGWGTSDTPGATPNPVEPQPAATTPTPATPPAAASTGFPPSAAFPPAGPPRPPQFIGRPRRNPVVMLVQFVVLAAIVFGIYQVVSAGKDAVDKVRGALNGVNLDGGSTTSTTSTTDENGQTPPQVKALQLFRPAGLATAVRRLQRDAPGRITLLSIRQDRMDLQVYAHGKQKSIDFQADAEAPTVLSTTTGATLTPGSFRYSDIDPKAPSRLMRAANARLNKSPRQVDYFVLQNFSGTLQWGIYYSNGNGIAQGDAHGRYTRRIS